MLEQENSSNSPSDKTSSRNRSDRAESFGPCISLRGVNTNNLKNIDLDIPIGEITCIYGPSGSGKSSLAFQTLYLESKRRLINALPLSASKLLWDIPQAAEVEEIRPILPVWALGQKNPVVGGRPNVADHLNLSERLQKLFFLAGVHVCPKHRAPLRERMVSQAENMDLATLFKEGEKLSICIHKGLFFRHFAEGPFPARVWHFGELVSFNPAAEFWELRGIRAPGPDQRKVEAFCQQLIEKNPFLSHETILVVSRERTKISLKLALKKEFYCDQEGHISLTEDLGRDFARLSPLNSAGACFECKGFGWRPIYDESLLVNNQKLSISAGGVTFLKYKKLERRSMEEKFLAECKKLGIPSSLPIEDFSPGEKDQFSKLLWFGQGSYPGAHQLLAGLEKKRYQRSVRIFLRRLQKEEICAACEGARIPAVMKHWGMISNQTCLTYPEILMASVKDAYQRLRSFAENIHGEAKRTKDDILETLDTSLKLNLGQVALSTKVRDLGPSQYQRILLAKLLSYKGSGSLFIFDEPTIGMDEREMERFFAEVLKLRDQGNTIIFVEHAEFIKKRADFLIEMGPGAGKDGGRVVFAGRKLPELGPLAIPHRPKIKGRAPLLKIKGLRLSERQKKVSLCLPMERIVLVKGDSESGKSALFIETIVPILEQRRPGENSLLYDSFHAEGEVSDTLCLDPSKAGERKESSRSTVGTFLGHSSAVRRHFAALPISKALGLKDGHFSPNSSLGRCPECEGRGLKVVEMSFLEDVFFTCDNCNGNKLRPAYGKISDSKGSVTEIYQSAIEELEGRIDLRPKEKRILRYLNMIHLGHLALERELSSLSGGERARLAFVKYLEKDHRHSFIVLKNISFGLAPGDLIALSDLLSDLVKKENSIIIIDQNPFWEGLAHFSLDFNQVKDSS